MIRFRPAPARELVADVRYYEKRYPGRGRRFMAAIDVMLARIAEAPGRYPLIYEPDIRSAKVQRFSVPRRLLVIDGVVDVLAIAHAKRRPRYWSRRLR